MALAKIKNLDFNGPQIFLTLLLVANTDVFIWADLVFPYLVSLIMPVCIKFSKKAWSFGSILSISSYDHHNQLKIYNQYYSLKTKHKITQQLTSTSSRLKNIARKQGNIERN